MSDFEAWAPEIPAEQQADIDEQLRKLQSSVGVVDDVIQWLEASIQLFGNVDSLGIDETTPDDQVKIALIVGKKMKLAFYAKAQEFLSTYSKFTEQKESNT